MTIDNRLESNESKLRDIVTVAKRTMTILLANSENKNMYKPDSAEDFKKYNEYVNTIITTHIRKKFNLV